MNDLRCSASVYHSLSGVELVENDFITEQKSIKNEVFGYISSLLETRTKQKQFQAELEGMRECHKNDAIAVVMFFHWLENQLQEKVKRD